MSFYRRHWPLTHAISFLMVAFAATMTAVWFGDARYVP